MVSNPKITISAKVLNDAAMARLRKAEKKILKQGEVTIKDLLNIGKETARTLVPKGKTGWLYRSIQGKTLTTRSGPAAKIYLTPRILPNDGVHRGKPNKNSNWKYVNFDLARWMHKSRKAVKHFGNEKRARFMYTTEEILEAQTGKVVKKNFARMRL